MQTDIAVSPGGTPNESSTSSSSWMPSICRACLRRLNEMVHQLCHCNTTYLKTTSRCLAVLFAAISIILLWCELVQATELKSPVGAMMGAYSRDKNAVIMQGVAFLALSYMSMCTYWSLFRLNLGWAYTLQGPQQSLPASLIFNGEYFSRLQFALGYNFLLFLNVPK